MIRTVLLALALLVPAALAQRAPDGSAPPAALDRYHEGAQAYVGGDLERAAAAVRAGLQMAPANPRLQALRDLIEQEQEEQDQQQGGGQNEDEQNPQGGGQGQPDDSGEGESAPGESGEPPPADEPEAEQDQTRTDPQSPGDEPNDGGSTGQRPGEGGATPQGEGAVPDGQMSRAQAAQILDAVGGDERLLLREIRRAPTRGRRADKDW